MSAAGLVEVRVPDMGNFKDVAVIDVLVKPGDSIELDTPLVTLETDKATMDVPSTAVGVVEKLHASKGGKVNTGDLVATVRAAAGASAGTASQPSAAAPATASAVPAATAAQPAPGPPAAPPAPPAAPAPPPASSAAPPAAANGAAAAGRSDLAPIDEPGFSRAHAGPSVRKFARELGVDLSKVAGHGFKDRITHEDVKAFVKGSLAG